MEQAKVEKSNKPKAPTASTVGLRVKRETKRRVMQDLAKINKKDFGKRIKADDLIVLALGLVQDHHLKQLQEASLSNTDRLQLQHRSYIRQHGNISKDEFIGKLLAGELSDSSVQTTAEVTTPHAR
jgi:hypothetical protein